MPTLPAAKQGPLTAVDLTAERKQLREKGYVPRSANGREWHFTTAGSPGPGEERATAIVPEARDNTPTLPIPVIAGEIARAVDETERRWPRCMCPSWFGLVSC